MGHRQLNREKREIIERLLGQGYSMRYTANVLGYSPSAISQEITRNSKYIDGKLTYRSSNAQRRARYRKKRYKTLTCKTKEVVVYVDEKLKKYWSPEQIHGRLKVEFPTNPTMRISFKTIYRWIAKSAAGSSPLGLKSKYTQYLRFKRQRKYVSKGIAKPTGVRKLPCITNRPEIAAQKVEFGHWEGDLVLGHRGVDNALTLVDMSTSYLVVTRCKDKRMATVSEAIEEALSNLPGGLVKTITLDRGSEFSAYEKVQKNLKCKVYFCHPQAPNERALNEQTNGLLRQFYPKRKRSVFSDPKRLTWAMDLINNRPRKKYGYRTTWEIIEERGLAKVLSLV